MGTTLRNLVTRIMVVFRLAIIASLVGYTVPNAYAAMHGNSYPAVESVAFDLPHGHRAQADYADAGRYSGEDDGLPRQAQKDCCQDFCVSIALPCEYQTTGTVSVSSVLVFVDDGQVYGTPPGPHRPPIIRS